jgi:protein-tyrosine phosphatase
MKHDLFWIPGPWQGRLAVAPRPRGGDWLKDEVAAWREAGLGTIISLLESDEAEQLGLAGEGSAVESAGMRFLSFPMPDRGVPASTRQALSLLGNIAVVLEQGQNVAVHCRQGIGRSGLIAAALLVMTGIDVEKAIGVVSAARGLTVPETPGQLEWIKHLPSDSLTVAAR